MKRKHLQIKRDTVYVAVSLLTVASFLFSCGDLQEFTAITLRRFGILTASFADPEAGIAVMRRHMSTVLGSEHQDEPVSEPMSPANEAQPEPAAPDKIPEISSPTAEETDLAAAESLVPEERRGPIEQAQYLSIGEGDNYFYYGSGSLRNATNIATSELQALVDSSSFHVDLERNSSEPQVLVVHTHSTESYDRFDVGFYDAEYPTRSTDSEKNVVAAGEVLCETLNALGICAVHATEYHDYPSYNNSYSRSRVTVQSYLDQYPSIKLVLDIHRDGIQREDGTRVKPTVLVGGAKAAQIMIVAAAGTDEDAVPNWADNLTLASRIQSSAEALFPGFTRPALFAYRYYNQDMLSGYLLVETGSESNTLTEAKNAMVLLAHAIDDATK